MNVKMSYARSKTNKDGSVRFYWERRGFLHQTLPTDPGERWAKVCRLNAWAEGAKAAAIAPDFGTVTWAVERYLGGDKFASKAKQTRKTYQRWAREFIAMWGGLTCREITLEVVEQFLAGEHFIGRSSSSKRQAKAALSNVLSVARRHKVITENPCSALDEMVGDKPRVEYWLPENEVAFLASCDSHEHGEIVSLVFMLLLFTAQRPSDVLAMSWGDYLGGEIRVVQQKTRTKLDVPAHQNLQTLLATTPRTSTLIVPLRGAPKVRYDRLAYMWNQVLAAAGGSLEHLQRRDLRRTAVVRMAEAGCTVPQIAAVTGHSIEQTQAIIDVYYVRTKKMARAAITLWEKSDVR